MESPENLQFPFRSAQLACCVVLPQALAQAIPRTYLWLVHIFGRKTDLAAPLLREAIVRESPGFPPLEPEMAVQVERQADLRNSAHPSVPHVGSGLRNRMTSCSSAFPSSASRPFARLERMSFTSTGISPLASCSPRPDDLERSSLLLLRRCDSASELVALSCCTMSSPGLTATIIAVSRDVPVDNENSSEVLVAGSECEGVDAIKKQLRLITYVLS